MIVQVSSGIISADSFSGQPMGGIKPKRLKKSGFTLVEILITIAVLAVGCMIALQAQTSSIIGASMSDNLTAATFLAEAELERIKALSFEDLAIEAKDGTKTTTGLNRLGQTTCINECSNFIFSRTVKYFPKVPTSLSHHIEINVSWNDRTGNHSILYGGAISAFTF
jgi:prepilin-type N-terminal cleavage/methylation domain-containing protein